MKEAHFVEVVELGGFNSRWITYCWVFV